ncbi:SAF domain-containing protein [Thermomonospora echinospora]|uniref:SAF domain-containing protein n=1 Tax=Thermomonospora echinospora TaxID=1992 RepID=A0A1H5YRN4_9ACTN|nr:SAF domain-containing protein [Thermomonospora echinospora]
MRRPSGRLARQRRPGWIAAGVTLTVLAVLTNVYLFQSAGHRVSVVRVARDVPVGQQISRADLDVAQVAVDAVQTIPAHQLDEVVGRQAAVGLRKGTLLATSQVTAQVAPQPGEALVTVPLKPSQVPAGLAPGWRVRVVFTPGSNGGHDATANGSPRRAGSGEVPAVVDQVGEPDTEGTVSVSLLVADAHSSTVARQAAAELVALVVTARRG